MKPIGMLAFATLLFSSTVYAAGLTCEQLAKLSRDVAGLREQGHSYEVAMSLVGGADRLLDAAIKDVYVLKLTPSQAFNHVSGLCIIASQRKGKK